MEVQYQRFNSNQGGNCSVTPLHLPQSLYGRTDGRTYGHVITKFSRLGGLPNFLTHGAPLARFARWSSAINNSLHLARKYARIFVGGHYLFRETNSFPRAKLEENCEIRGTDNVQGQISVHIFEAKWMLLCLLSFKYFLQGRILGDFFSKLLNVKEILSALKILLVCLKTSV